MTQRDRSPSLPFSAPIKRLTREHFALYRGYLAGIAVEQLHATYGDSSGDVRSTRRLIATLRDTLSGAARRTRDIEAAHLLRLKPGSIPAAERYTQVTQPTLEAFRDATDPDGVFGEAEVARVVSCGIFRCPASTIDRRSVRNDRLRRRQADALARMEGSLVQAPQPAHPVAGWFEPAIAGRLIAASIRTLADLLAFIERRGQRWYATVPKIGPKGARRLTDWLSLHANSLGHTLSARAVIPRRQLDEATPSLAKGVLRAGIAPLEWLEIPLALNGAAGKNRHHGEGRQPVFTVDKDAINAWLASHGASVHTVRAYRREAERLHAWALEALQKPLSSLTQQDCRVYIEQFLRDPQPSAKWIGPSKTERSNPDWRPFLGALSDRSRETARTILHAMAQWLVQQQYWRENPFASLALAPWSARIAASNRSLTAAQTHAVQARTTRNPHSRRDLRDHLAFELAYETGLRRAELAQAVIGDIDFSRSVIRAVDKRGFERSIALSQHLVQLIHAYLRARQLAPRSAPNSPLIAHARTGEPITADGMGQVFRSIFTRSKHGFDVENADASMASTHWVRHTHSFRALEGGESIRDLQVRLGHANVSTTRLYETSKRI